MIYDSVRIEPDDETFLVWPRKRYACVIFNLHVEHTPDRVASTALKRRHDPGELFQSNWYRHYRSMFA